MYTEDKLRAGIRANLKVRLNTCLDVIFDDKKINMLEVGVYRGNLIASILARPSGARVYAVEPNPEVVHEVKKRFTTDVSFYNVGLGNKSGEGILYVTEHTGYSSQFEPNPAGSHSKRIYNDKLGSDGFEVVKKIPFEIIEGDKFLNGIGVKSIDFMSLNTQGTEYQILEGLKNFLSSGRIKTILVENDLENRYLGAKDDFAEQQALLRDNGFQLFDIVLIRELLPVGIRRLYPLYVHESLASRP